MVVVLEEGVAAGLGLVAGDHAVALQPPAEAFPGDPWALESLCDHTAIP